MGIGVVGAMTSLGEISHSSVPEITADSLCGGEMRGSARCRDGFIDKLLVDPRPYITTS